MVEAIKKQIQNDSIRIVSFDLFDTILMRPCSRPSDLFTLLNDHYNRRVQTQRLQFSEIRKRTESFLIEKNGVENVTLDAIYQKIGETLRLSNELVRQLVDYEIRLELELSHKNECVVELLQAAHQLGKRVIIVTDTYLPKDVVQMLLKKHGIFCDGLYVSSEIGMRKDSGELFDHIIDQEKVSASQLFHLGDNKHSDFEIPSAKGLNATQYIHETAPYRASDGTSFVLGFLAREENKLKGHATNRKFDSPYELGYYALGPTALATGLKILTSKQVQSRYRKIFFTARDGYVPMQVYEYLRGKMGIGLESQYLFCSRRSLFISKYSGSVLGFLLSSLQKSRSQTYDLKALFHSSCLDPYFDESHNCQIYKIEPKELMAALGQSIKDSDGAAKFLSERLVQAKAYFQNCFGSDNRILVFDCGYSGSVSKGIMELTDKKVDKIYLWETRQNRMQDWKSGTKTFSFCGRLPNDGFHLVFEELFSPLQASCVGYRLEGPILDEYEIFDDATSSSIAEVHRGIMKFVEKFCEVFAEHLNSIGDVDVAEVYEQSFVNVFKKGDKSLDQLSKITFLDAFCFAEPQTLLAKVRKLTPDLSDGTTHPLPIAQKGESLKMRIRRYPLVAKFIRVGGLRRLMFYYTVLISRIIEKFG